MPASRAFTLVVGVLLCSAACSTPATLKPVFLQGRAVAADGDSLFAVTDPAAATVVLLDRAGRVQATIGAGTLSSPRKVQLNSAAVYVSDVDSNRPLVIEFGRDGTFRRRIDLDTLARQPHQFAVLPDGAVVVETEDQRLVAVRDDSVTTFAVIEVGTRPSLLTAAGGGVLHAVPDRWITLYNSFGSIRWRVEWPWDETAFVSDLAVDHLGRLHVLAGNSVDGTFRTFTLAAESGEVFRWSVPTEQPDFVVDRFGQVEPAGERWTNR